MTACRLSLVACLSAAFALTGLAHADDGRRPARGATPPPRAAEQAARPQRPVVPSPRAARNDALADSVRRVQSRTGGQVLSAERVPYDGRDISRVKVVDDRGRVRVYMDDPSSRRAPRPTRGDDD
ncbi:PepSY domain-containing protein [Luteimonas arsenica]|uniref:PepSY domain-containing protein n=1 Tax=Luteimonas arsenica TaxID=1586242 RepID=UPI003CCD77BE